MPIDNSAVALTMQADGAHGLIRVAIADDSEDLCLLLAELINSTPGMTCVAQIAKQDEVLDAVAACQPDVLLLDLLFGGVSSLPLVPQIRAVAAQTRIVIHSGYDLDRLADGALGGGAIAVIPKGGDPEELIAAIHRIGSARVDH